ncbi:hypothetical protein M405DRAFT_232215 [Rhizopogon salebrosus TDB-379]|nr:hypothetical protein M405DRAFT_232215 [Rhizopogon salebrosus TDB-379]
MLRPLVPALDAGGGVEAVGIQPQPSLCICTVIITPSPYSQFYDPEGHISCGYLLAFQEAPQVHWISRLLAVVPSRHRAAWSPCR